MKGRAVARRVGTQNVGVMPGLVEPLTDFETRASRESVDASVPGPIAPLVSVIVTTHNNAANVQPLVARLQRAQRDVPIEVVIVDDSDDETPIVSKMVAEKLAPDLVVRVLHRPPGARRGGLGGAVVEGLRVARAPWACAMDAHLQHPPELVRSLLDTAQAKNATLVVASRYCDSGDPAGPSPRTPLSRAASGAAKLAFPRELDGITDPMSGFFLVRRDAVDLNTLTPGGFPVLLEIVLRTDGLRVAEVGYSLDSSHVARRTGGGPEGMRYWWHLGHSWVGTTRRSRSYRTRVPHRYDVHGIIRVESDGALPELEVFRVGALSAEPDIAVRIGTLPHQPVSNGAAGKHNPFRFSMRYAEAGNLGFGADIELEERVQVLATRLLALSPHVLYTNLVEPILRWQFVRRGYALVHGACVVQGDDAFLITARTDTGKTTTMLKLLDALPYEFVSDDLTLVSPDGRVLPYPKPLTISNHTLRAVNRNMLTWKERATLPVQSRLHSRSGRRVAFMLSSMGLPSASLNAVV